MFRYAALLRRSAARRHSLHFGHRGACAIPHPEKAYRGGEDAFLSHPSAIGVADGVGGYASHGIDPAIYTRNVMRFSLEAVKADKSPDGLSALAVLEYGARKAKEADQPGGCPVVLVTLVEDTFASILNLGDCGVLVMRNGELLFRSEMQQSQFNCPFQLPSDPPSRGDQAKLQLREGDLFLCASDGVLDNVELDDMLKALQEVDAKGCVHAATLIGELAHRRGHDRHYASPFARHAAEAGYRFMGGKLDDVTAVVAKVTLREDAMASGGPELISDLLKTETK